MPSRQSFLKPTFLHEFITNLLLRNSKSVRTLALTIILELLVRRQCSGKTWKYMGFIHDKTWTHDSKEKGFIKILTHGLNRFELAAISIYWYSYTHIVNNTVVVPWLLTNWDICFISNLFYAYWSVSGYIAWMGINLHLNWFYVNLIKTHSKPLPSYPVTNGALHVYIEICSIIKAYLDTIPVFCFSNQKIVVTLI